MKKFYTGLLLLAVLWSSCHEGTGNITNKCGACPLYLPAMLMRVQIVNKTTGADLFLAPNSPYKLTDLKLSSSTSGPIDLFPVDTANRVVLLSDAVSQTYTLKLASLTADNIKVVAGPGSDKCCPITEVKSIMLNDSLVCAPCNFTQLVTIRK